MECPKCGEAIATPDTVFSSVAQTLHTALEVLGGPEEYGRILADDFKQSGGHQRGLMHTRMHKMMHDVEAIDSKKKDRQHIKATTQDAVMRQWALEEMENNPEFLKTTLIIAEKKGLLQPNLKLVS